MASLVLRLLGDFQARLPSGRLLTVGGKKAEALLACLAVASGNSLTRAKLAGILWSGRGDGHARNSLRQTLTALRRDLAAVDPFPLDTGRERLKLVSNAVDVDVWTFERLAAFDDAEALARAAALYRGDFLDGIHLSDPAFDEWSSAERERLRQLAAGVMERLAARQAGADALATAHRLLALDPLREASHRIVMRAYASHGETNLALRQYESCREALHRELGVAPDAKTEALWREIRDARSGAMCGASANPFRSAAPAPLLSEGTRRPAVAVLPFVAMSGDAEQKYLGDGIAEDIVTELSRFRALSVMARNSSFRYRDGKIDAGEVACDLAVGYVLEGSIRKIGSRTRITVQLIDAATRDHLWAERYDCDAQDVVSAQDDIVAAVVTRVARHIEAAQIEKARRKHPQSLEVEDYILRGTEHFRRADRGDFEAAVTMFRKAIAVDPGYARAHAWLACASVHTYWAHAYAAQPPHSELQGAFEAAATALALDGNDSRSHVALANVQIARRSFDLARRHVDAAMALNPHDAWAATTLSWIETCAGRADAALACLDLAERLDPDPPNWYWATRGQALYRLHRYADALAAFERMSAAREVWVDRFHAASLAQLGRHAEARAKAAEALRRDQSFTLHRYTKVEPYMLQADIDHLIGGMRKAGLPD